mmetsp:Transcript_28571/g.48291  ORF Transcript_28571/g.48291 Transcript_28571/m.48291 type:complete len:419 (-) Transcript_28571:278-1534(-)
MMSLFYPTTCPVFAVEWIGESEDHLFHAGGGGSARTGVKNSLFLSVIGSEVPPSITEVSAFETGSQICTSAHADKPRGSCQLIAGGLGDALVIFGIAPSLEIIPLSGSIIAAKDEATNNGDLDVKIVAFDRSRGSIVATGDGAGVIRLFKLENVGDVISALSTRTNKEDNGSFSKTLKVSKAVKKLVGHTGAITNLQFDKIGKRLCSSSKDGTCRLWDVSTASEMCVLPATSGLPPVFSKDKKELKQMCRSCMFSPIDDRVIFTLQNAARGSSYATRWFVTEAADSRMEGSGGAAASCEPQRVVLISSSPVPCMAVSFDGLRLVAGDTQGTVFVLDATSLRKLYSYEGHQLPVSCLSLACPNAESNMQYDIISGSGDKTLILGSSRSRSRPFFFSFYLLAVALVLLAVAVLLFRHFAL